MTRLRMIQYISDCLVQFNIGNSLKERNLIADVMLAESEKYGMKPPFNEAAFQLAVKGKCKNAYQWETE